MTAPDSLLLHALAEDNLAAASPDLLRAMIKTFADTLMSAEADALCNAEYGQVSDERVPAHPAGSSELACRDAGVDSSATHSVEVDLDGFRAVGVEESEWRKACWSSRTTW